VTVTDHPAVAAYLARFDAVSAHLPPARRQELRADLLEHLGDAVPAGADHAGVRAALDRLGPPEEIVGAEAEPPASPAGRAPVQEALAVLLLTVGSAVPVLGWLVGAALLWTSKRWTRGEKLLGTLVVPAGPYGVVMASITVPILWSGVPGVALAVLWLALFVAPFVVGATLYARAARRAGADRTVLAVLVVVLGCGLAYGLLWLLPLWMLGS
jgi:hypothetical protein